MIKSENYITTEVRKAAEQEAIANLMESFTEFMFKQTLVKVNGEYSGWDKASQDTVEKIKSSLADAVNRGDWIDVSIASMLLWNLHQPDQANQ
jgi:hypothetical protein